MGPHCSNLYPPRNSSFNTRPAACPAQFCPRRRHAVAYMAAELQWGSYNKARPSSAIAAGRRENADGRERNKPCPSMSKHSQFAPAVAGSSAPCGWGIGLPVNELNLNIRIYLIRLLGHSNIRIYSNIWPYISLTNLILVPQPL